MSFFRTRLAFALAGVLVLGCRCRRTETVQESESARPALAAPVSSAEPTKSSPAPLVSASSAPEAPPLFDGRSPTAIARFLYHQGRDLYVRNSRDEAQKTLETAIQYDPKLAPPYNTLGRIAADSHQKEKAEMLFLKCLELDPQYYFAAQNLATMYFWDQRYEEAKKYAELARQVEPGDPITLKLLKDLSQIESTD